HGVGVGTVIAGGEDDGDAVVVDFFGGLIDGVVGVPGLGAAAGAPRIVDDLEVVLAGVIQQVVETREGPQDQERVAGANAHQGSVLGDTLIEAATGSAVAGRDAGDVGAVARGGIGVRQPLDIDRFGGRLTP